jgi:hypothetical protein
MFDSAFRGGTRPGITRFVVRQPSEYFSSADQLLTLRMFDITPSVESWTFARDNEIDIVAEMGMWVPELDALLNSELMHPGHTYNHCSGPETTQVYLHADMTIKEQALARVQQSGTTPGRYRPPDSLLAFLDNL